jgi:uncharacterized protein YndB with AHSA1/START domain
VSRNEAVIDAPVEVVFEVLRDARRYEDWVVGAWRIRDVSPDFPEPGSRFGHKIGFWPLFIHDETKVLECEAEHHLLLQAEVGALGAATVDLRLTAEGNRTRVELIEKPVTGPLRWVHNPLQDTAFWVRNWLSLQLLKAIAEGHGGEPREPSGEPE